MGGLELLIMAAEQPSGWVSKEQLTIPPNQEVVNMSREIINKLTKYFVPLVSGYDKYGIIIPQ